MAHFHRHLNVKRRFSSFVPESFHNLTKSDPLSNLEEVKYQKDLSVPFETFLKTDERFTTVAFGHLRSIGSLNFMKMRLDTVVEALG